MAPVVQSYREEKGAEFGTSADTMIYNGPYLLTEFDVGGTSITVVRNDKFTGYGAGATNVDEVGFVKIEDSQQAVLAYENGDVDIVKLTGEQVEANSSNEAFTQVGSSSVTYLAINCATYDNENLRNALLHSLDKDALCSDVLKNGSIPAYFIVPSGLAQDAEGKDFRDSADTYGVYDVAKAQEYWEAAKAELAVDTYSMDFLITSDEDAYTVGAWIQDQIQTALPGMTVNLVTVPYENKMNKVMAGDFGFAVITWGADYADPETWTDPFNDTSTYNFIYKSADPATQALYAEYTELVKAAKAITDDMEARYEAFAKAEAFLLDHGFAIPFSISERTYQFCNLDLFEGQYASFGGANQRYKDQHLYTASMGMDEYNAAYSEWLAARAGN